MFSKKFLTTCVALIATSALQMDYVIAESQVAQQLTDMLSGFELGNMPSAGVDQNGSPTASVNFFGLTANAGANPLGQVQLVSLSMLSMKEVLALTMISVALACSVEAADQNTGSNPTVSANVGVGSPNANVGVVSPSVNVGANPVASVSANVANPVVSVGANPSVSAGVNPTATVIANPSVSVGWNGANPSVSVGTNGASVDAGNILNSALNFVGLNDNSPLAGVSVGANPGVSVGANPGVSVGANPNAVATASVNGNTNPAPNTNSGVSVNANATPNANAGTNENTNVTPNANAEATVTANTNTNVNGNAKVSAQANASRRSLRA